MTDILLHGCMGQMGQVVARLAEESDDLRVTAGVDQTSAKEMPFPVFSSVADCDKTADVVIDFSVAGAVDRMLSDCIEKSLPVVLCTTGLSEEQLQRVRDAAERIAIVKSANMSLGINLLLKLVRDAAPLLKASGFDIEIVERHHRRKLDAPSGTALMLADAARDALDCETPYVFDRSGRKMQRPADEIGISAVRGGTIVGDHDVIFAGTDEVITLSHSAYSRAVFAKGALAAARFLKGREPGLYTMNDVIG